MAQLLKMTSNAKEEVARLRHLEKDWGGALVDVTREAMELARRRFLQRLVPDGADWVGPHTREVRIVRSGIRGRPPKSYAHRYRTVHVKGYWKYKPTPGATIRAYDEEMRRYNQIVWGGRKKVNWSQYGANPPIFHKNKIVSRSGETERVFKKAAPGLIMDVLDDTKGVVGLFGVRGTIEGRIAAHETGRPARGGHWSKFRPRHPLSNALRYGAARFPTLMLQRLRKLEQGYNAK